MSEADQAALRLQLIKAGWRPLAQATPDGPEGARSCGHRHLAAWASVVDGQLQLWVEPGGVVDTVECTVQVLEQLADERNALATELAELHGRTHALHREGPVALCPACTP